MPDVVGPIRQILRPTLRARLGWIKGRTPLATPGAFIAGIAHECRAIDARVKTTIRQSTPRNRIVFPILDLPPDAPQVGAWCRTAGKSGDCCVVVNPGVMMAIDDLALAVASLPNFLVPDRSTLRRRFETPGSRPTRLFEAAGHAQADLNRFWNYRAGMRGLAVDPAIITFSMPLDGWRLHQASVVAELAIAWVLFHEYSHWLLAHLSLLSEAERRIGLAEHSQPRVPNFSARPGRPRLPWPNVLISQTLEILADASALLLLVNYTRLNRGPAARFNRAMAQSGKPADPQVLGHIDMFQTVRLCLTAASLACIVLDGYRGGAHLKDSTHPSPSARFMNMQSQILAAWPGLLEGKDGSYVVVGGDEESEFSVQRLAEAIAMTAADTDLIAALAASARGRPDQLSQHDPRSWSAPEWRTDMRRQWRTGEEEVGVDTDAGRELDRLLADDPGLIAELLYIQTEQFGSTFSISL